MCGIAGWIDFREDLRKKSGLVEKMVEVIKHRGPDAEDVFVSQNAVLGHCRLIVVDPEGGMQPMSRRKENDSYTITYNGEIYNAQELRVTLEKKGYQFQSRNSDTEVLLFAYME
jgi:asparagine synthase (glutamine-hydrolysing)